MRILHVTRDYAPFSKGGGVERYIHQLALHHSACGHEVTVAARSIDPNHRAAYAEHAPTTRTLLQLIRQSDCIHIHGPRTAYAAFAGLLAALLGKPVFYTIHCFYRGKTPQQTAAKFLWDHTVERLLLHITRTIVLSTHWRDYLTHAHLPTRRVTILPNGIHTAFLARESYLPIPLPGAPAILSVSRLDPVKRLGDAIAALAQPGLEPAHLHLVGSGGDEARLRAAADAHHVADRTHFHGFKTDAEVAAMARAAHVFVIASAEEGMPTTILEMFARRLPVAASAIPGNLSLTTALDWPHTFPLGNVPALAATILAAQHTPVPDALAAKLAQQFDWQIIAERMHHLYTLG